ncbi:MAG TPA: hypothetical protein VG986_03730 [Pseudolabrys sp.]|nr:hypothetical protein [Pseudolabrys sp.]
MKLAFTPALACALLAVSVFAASPASADNAVISCGAPIKSTVKTQYNQEFTTTSTTYVNVPKALVTVNVPKGQTQCVKVRFWTTLTCTVVNANDHCYIKVNDSLTPLLWVPAAAAYSSDTKGSVHGFEWATRLSEGSHVLQMKASANNGTTLNMSSWVLDVETAK